MTPSLFARETGAGPDAVVLLHGFGGWHGAWNGIADGLSGRMRVIAYDLPGHAGSLACAGEASAKRAADAILGDLASRGAAKVHIAGHSLGGAVAMLMAMAAPERVASLTLLAPGGIGPEINAPLLNRFALARSAAEIADCLAGMSAPGASIRPDNVVAMVAQRAVPGQTAALSTIAAAITRDGRQGTIPAGSLASLAMPVVCAWGTADPVLPFSQAEALPAQVAVHAVAGAGHMLIEEAPDVVADLIRRALDRPAGSMSAR